MVNETLEKIVIGICDDGFQVYDLQNNGGYTEFYERRERVIGFVREALHSKNLPLSCIQNGVSQEDLDNFGGFGMYGLVPEETFKQLLIEVYEGMPNHYKDCFLGPGEDVYFE